jgi:hypothetical protein
LAEVTFAVKLTTLPAAEVNDEETIVVVVGAAETVTCNAADALGDSTTCALLKRVVPPTKLATMLWVPGESIEVSSNADPLLNWLEPRLALPSVNTM